MCKLNSTVGVITASKYFSRFRTAIYSNMIVLQNLLVFHEFPPHVKSERALFVAILAQAMVFWWQTGMATACTNGWILRDRNVSPPKRLRVL